MENLDIYYADNRLTHLVALIDIFINHNNLQDIIFFDKFILFDLDETLEKTDVLHLSLIRGDSNSYFELLHNLIHDPARSGKLALDGTRYATAAEVCLAYLCDRSGGPQKMPRRRDRRDDKIRRNTPWLWRRIIGVLQKSRIWWKKNRDHFYHSKIKWALDLSDPVIAQRVWSEKYSLGLLTLPFILPSSVRQIRRTCSILPSTYPCLTVNSRSQEFPYQVKKLRRTMMEYLERVDAEEAKI